MSDWQLIETAPKNGDWFLISTPDAKKNKVRLSRGESSREAWFVNGGCTVFDDRGNGVRATHWMPLPAPPVPVGTGREG